MWVYLFMVYFWVLVRKVPFMDKELGHNYYYFFAIYLRYYEYLFGASQRLSLLAELHVMKYNFI